MSSAVTVVLDNCNKSAMKHSTETPVLLNFVNLIYNILSKIVEGHTWATRKTRNYSFICGHLQCVNSDRIWIFSAPYFPPFGLNADQKNSEYGHFSRSVDLLNAISIQKQKKISFLLVQSRLWFSHCFSDEALLWSNYRPRSPLQLFSGQFCEQCFRTAILQDTRKYLFLFYRFCTFFWFKAIDPANISLFKVDNRNSTKG